MFPLMGGTAMPGLLSMQGGYGADPRQQGYGQPQPQQPFNWGTFVQKYFPTNPDRSDQGPAGNQPDAGNPMAPRRDDKRRNPYMSMGAIGLQMLQPQQPQQQMPPWMQIGNKRYG